MSVNNEAAELALTIGLFMRKKNREFQIRDIENGLTSVQSLADTVTLGIVNNEWVVDYPGVIQVDPISREPYSAQELASIQAALNRLERLARLQWTPVVTIPGEEGPDYHTGGETVTGVPYSSVRTLGRTVGQDCSPETFLTAVANPDSELYKDFTRLGYHPGPGKGTGTIYFGNVCSNFIFYGMTQFYSPITAVLDRDWASWGMLAQYLPGMYSVSDIRRGDVFNSVGGGHIEIVYDITATTVTLFDQAHEGPEWTTYTFDELMEYVTRRNYALLLPDWGRTITDTPDIWAPLPSETLGTPVVNDTLLLDRGNKSNYNVGDAVRVNLIRNDLVSLFIEKDGTLIETVTTGGSEIVERVYTTPGKYTFYASYVGGGTSKVEECRFADVSGVASSNTVNSGDDVTVTFTTDADTTVRGYLVRQRSTLSIRNGDLKQLTQSEIDAGMFTFEASFPARDYDIRLIATNEYGNVFDQPITGIPLTVE